MKRKSVALAMSLAVMVGVLTATPAQARVNCYVQKAGWVLNGGGDTAIGKPAFEIHYCTNKAGGRVHDVPYFQCWDNGGFGFYEGCKHSVGGFGYSSLGINVKWHWVVGFDSIGLALWWYCDYRGSVYADGRTPTSWIVCDHGKGF